LKYKTQLTGKDFVLISKRAPYESVRFGEQISFLKKIDTQFDL
jgi:hypothetical protein